MRPFISFAGALLVSALWPGVVQAVDCANENTAIPFSTPTSDFTLNPDGTATHHKTGLIWDRCVVGQTGEDCSGGSPNTTQWQGALQNVKAANLNNYKGHNDWRLPNVKELESIVETRCWDPSINTTVFPNTTTERVWSSTVFVASPTAAFAVIFGSGLVSPENKTSAAADIRLVRGGGVYDTFNAQFPLLLLSVAKSGGGGGTVTATSGPCTLDGTGHCLVDSGSDVTLHAEADPDSVFAGWSASAGSVPTACDGMLTDCLVETITANGSVSATFWSQKVYEHGFESDGVPPP